jgi:hypothetical protein
MYSHSAGSYHKTFMTAPPAASNTAPAMRLKAIVSQCDIFWLLKADLFQLLSNVSFRQKYKPADLGLVQMLHMWWAGHCLDKPKTQKIEEDWAYSPVIWGDIHQTQEKF